MSSRIVDAQRERSKHDVQRRIGRLRRRIDRRLRATGREARRLVSWRTYVKSCPGNAIMAAFGVGLALSAGLGARRLAGWLGRRLIGRAVDKSGRQLWREVERVWADSAPDHRATRTSGADDGRA